jgi:dihydroflavonol-4-reductase
MNALVTGATGFVGANLIEALNRRGWPTRALRRPSSSLKALEGLIYESAIGDVNDRATLDSAMGGIDVVFHVAAAVDYWRNSTEKIMRVNVDGTRTVLEAAHAAGVRRVVVTSSVAALGQPAFGQALDERAKFNLRPSQFAYGYSKHLAEEVARAFVALGLEVVIVNPSVVLGPRDVNLISGSMIVEAVRQPLFFYPPGGVGVIDVADCCEAHIAAAECGRTGQRYILNGENLSHKQIFDVVADAVGRPRPWLPVPGALLRASGGAVDALRGAFRLTLPVNGEQVRFSAETFWFDSSKARRELGLVTRPFAETVKRTYEWYKGNGYL